MPRCRLLVLLLLSLSSPCFADLMQDLQKTHVSDDFKYRDAWTLKIAPYVWFANLHGQANLQGNRARFNEPYSKLLQDLDSTIGADFEAQKGPWTFIFDPDYVKITQRIWVNNLLSNTNYETTITDTGVFYRLYPQPSTCHFYPLSAEIFGGARIVTMHTSIQYIDPAILRISDTSNLIVPLLGFRVIQTLNPCFKLWFNASIGGFQVTHVSNTWSAALGMNYTYNKHLDLSFGYKTFGMNYSIQAVSINTQLQGPLLGLSYSW